MDLQARKYDLIQALVKIQDIGLIEKLEEMIDSYSVEGKGWWNDVSDQWLVAIDEGIEQLDRGKGISHADARDQINKVLSQ